MDNIPGSPKKIKKVKPKKPLKPKKQKIKTPVIIKVEWNVSYAF